MDNYNYYNEYQMTAVRKGKKAPLIVGISAALLLGGSGAAYAAVPVVNNAVNKTIMSPEKYCRKVYSTALDDAVSKMKDVSNQSGNLYSSAFSFEFSDELKDMINESLGSEICGKVSFECETGYSKSSSSVVECKGVLKADGNEALNADIIYDAENGVLYLTIPELSSKTLKIEASDEEQTNVNLIKTNPEEYSKLINEYVKVLEKYSANENTMRISDESGTAAGVPYSYTKLVTVIDGEQVKALLADTADFMEKSDVIKDLYEAYTAPYKAFSEDLTFEKTVDEIRNADTSDFKEITLDTLVDANGDIRGLKVTQGYKNLFEFAEAKNKNDIGIEFGFEDDLSVTVNAVQSKNEYTGTLKAQTGDKEVFSADFSKFKIKNDSIDCTFSFDIPDILGESEEQKHAEVVISANDKSQKYEMNIDSIGKVTFENKLCKNKADVKIPDNAETVDDIDSISEYFDKEDAINSVLEKFGLSEDIFAPKSYYYSDDSDMNFGFDTNDDGSMTYSFGDDSDWSFDYYSDWSNEEESDSEDDWFTYDEGTEDGSWVENEDGWFEWVPAA